MWHQVDGAAQQRQLHDNMRSHEIRGQFAKGAEIARKISGKCAKFSQWFIGRHESASINDKIAERMHCEYLHLAGIDLNVFLPFRFTVNR